MDGSDGFLPFEVQNKMAMSSSAHSCKISMLWNWYTIDSCFIARSWHVTSRGMFAGTCIGVFFWVVSYCWLHRFIVEYDNAIVDFKTKKYQLNSNCCCAPEDGSNSSVDDKSGAGNMEHAAVDTQIAIGTDFWTPLMKTFQHQWLFSWINKKENLEEKIIYPSALEHFSRSGLYLMEWTVSYLIMLMWMYYNGYLIITMILGYFFGQLLFNYTPLTIVNNKNYTTPSCE